jgi:hypothetical protein
MILKISKNTHPEIWDAILSCDRELVEMEHRRGASFFTNAVYTIGPDDLPENPELHGNWISNQFVWDDNAGSADEDIEVLHRAEKTTIQVEKEVWRNI